MPDQDKREISLKGAKVAILLATDFEDMELQHPMEHLKNAGADVVLLGAEAHHEYRGEKGLTLTSDASIKAANAKDFDAVVIPGGYGPDKMRLEPKFSEFVKDMYYQGKIVAAVCHGPLILISAGIVKEKTVTSWPSIVIDLQNAGAHWIDKEVVCDGNIITSRKPSDLDQFSSAILQQLVHRLALV